MKGATAMTAVVLVALLVLVAASMRADAAAAARRLGEPLSVPELHICDIISC